ncbi:hypothetical protein H0H93_003487 [Arthromyces matolae]|nr:hypothetical protein H0H93_003487 [Arthromyces matolae]
MRCVCLHNILVLAFILRAVAVPLGLEFKDTGPALNKWHIERSTALANKQIEKMRQCLERTRNRDAETLKLYHAAFGTKANLEVIDKTIKALETGNFKVQLQQVSFEDGVTRAEVPWDRDTNEPGPAMFSRLFYDSGEAERAGVIIHEATHQLAMTGDELNSARNFIRPPKFGGHPTDVKAYYMSGNYPQTVESVNKDLYWPAIRDKANDVHHKYLQVCVTTPTGAIAFLLGCEY